MTNPHPCERVSRRRALQVTFCSSAVLALNLRSVGAEAPVDRAVFEDVYPEGDFSCPCSAVLGNHDYSDNPGGEQAQLRYAKRPGTRWHMPAKWYRTDVGGARTRALSRRDRPVPFARDVHGFTHVHLVGDELRISHHTVDGAVVHRFTKRSDGGVQMDAV